MELGFQINPLVARLVLHELLLLSLQLIVSDLLRWVQKSDLQNRLFNGNGLV
jgi:hypothetical protein